MSIVDVVVGVVIEDSVELIVVLEVELMDQRAHLQKAVRLDVESAIQDSLAENKIGQRNLSSEVLGFPPTVS